MLYLKSKAVTVYEEFPLRSHFTLGEEGWELVAATTPLPGPSRTPLRASSPRPPDRPHPGYTPTLALTRRNPRLRVPGHQCPLHLCARQGGEQR
jgi:hypothetical protein